MTGRRLLDIAAIFKASRGVAAKHVALRQHQLDVYSKTSSLAKAIKSQTDRVTLTVKAASDLAKRFDEPGPDYSTQAGQSERSSQDTIGDQDSASGVNKNSEKDHGLSRDHAYKTSDQDSPAESPAYSILATKQERGKKYPLPDGSTLPVDHVEVSKRDEGSYSEMPQTKFGKAPLADRREATDEGLPLTLSGRTSSPNSTFGKALTASEKDRNRERQAEKRFPSQAAERSSAAHSEESGLQANRDQDVFYTPSLSDEQVVSALPQVKLPQTAEDAQNSDEHVPDAQLNQDVFYSASSRSEGKPLPQAQAVPEQDALSDEAYTELFHSPRVARMLGGQPNLSKPSKGLEMTGAQETALKQTKRPQEKDQVSSSVRISAREVQDGAPSPASDIVDSRPPRHSQANGSEDVRKLAADMTKDASTMPADASQISPDLVRNVRMTLILVD